MKKRLFAIAVVVAFGAGAAHADPEDAQAKLDSMERTGEIVDCLNLGNVSQIYAVDETTILVKAGVSQYYVAETSDCSGALHRNARFEHETTQNRLCRGDNLRVVDYFSGALRGACRVGSFEKLSKKPA